MRRHHQAAVECGHLLGNRTALPSNVSNVLRGLFAAANEIPKDGAMRTVRPSQPLQGGSETVPRLCSGVQVVENSAIGRSHMNCGCEQSQSGLCEADKNFESVLSSEHHRPPAKLNSLGNITLQTHKKW